MSGMSANGGQTPSPKKAQTLPTRIPSKRSNSYNDSSPKSPLSPSLSLRDMQEDAAATQFPLTNIDNPNDIAQELSNLQKLRRLSMDVGNNSSLDPDMLPFSGMSLMAMPSIAPTGGDDEGDPSRLLWVPARVHPELAPMEFKSFLENRVQSIKRRSGESFLSAGESSDTSGSGGGSGSPGSLRRKKSMLSRQIDNSGGNGGTGYVDGAERLERKRSSSGLSSTPELSLEELAKDPTKAIQKLTLETQHPGGEGSMEDMPILPVAPGMGLRRSTRTTYRKGGSVRGERLPFSKRVAAARQAEAEAQEGKAPTSPSGDAPKGHTLARIQTEPAPENYSRPGPKRSVRRQQKFSQDSTTSTEEQEGETVSATEPTRPYQDVLSVRSPASDASSPVPQIVEPGDSDEDEPQAQPARPFPQRSSSQKVSQLMGAPGTTQQSQQQYPADEPPAKSSKRPAAARPAPTSPTAQQPISKPPQPQDTPSQAATIPVDSRVNSTDSLTFIPTYSADDRKEKRGKKDKDDDAGSVSSTKSSSWKWFKGSTDDKKKKDEDGKKSKAKAFVERAHDNARLDVLQTSIENAVSKGRESLLLDRESIDNKLYEERKKESNRKSDGKKDKDSNLLSFLGIGSKRKSDKESSEKKKGQHLRVSEDCEKVYRPLRPDVDYHWTRFPLLEERAIYRMAHIKLANPRRSLHSQVLLSNFMYNYLAIVQSMHPQMQVPVSPQQKRLQEEERKRKEAEQKAYLAEQQKQQQKQQQQQQQQQQDGADNYGYDYHRVGSGSMKSFGTALTSLQGANHGQYGEAQADEIEYMDDSQIYEYDHGDQDDYQDQHNGYGQHGYRYEGHHEGDDGRGYQAGGGGSSSNRDDMW
jgi:hypothetical protein